MEPLIFYLFIINATSFLLMLIDKQKARKSRYRIPEAVLLGAALVGGSLGSLLGMYTAHHKTKKFLFAVGIPIVLLAHIILLFIFYI